MKTNDKTARLALNCYVKLMRSADSVTVRTSRAMQAADLTVSQFGVLEALYHKGPLCQRDVAAKILKSTGNITMVVDNLEKRQLVRRERDSQDRRYVTLNLTETGAALIAKTFPEVEAAIVAEMGVLSGTELKVLGELCRRLGLKQENA